jgi:hypothetical protein
MMRRTLLVLSAMSLLLRIQVAEAQLTGPILGYTLDTEGSAIRMIRGIPGASAVGEPLDVDIKIGKAVVSMERDYALAVIDGTKDVALISNLSGAALVSAISGVHDGGDAIAISPDGSSAAIYSLERSRIQVVDGLPSDPFVHSEVDTISFEKGLTAIAISRDKQILAAFTGADGGALYLFGSGLAPRFVARAGEISGIRFAPASDDAVVTDRVWNQVLLLQNLSTTASPIQLASAADGVSGPIAVLLSLDGKTAYAANAGSGTVTVVNLAGGPARDVACNCELTTMQELKGGSVFALTGQSDAPIVVFDGSGGDPRFVLVPPREKVLNP